MTDFDFQELKLTCRVVRNGGTIYDSGELLTGERHMSHSLVNCEDHHFKYPQHRIPGDLHLHFFGTSRLSYGTRDWEYADGDEIHEVQRDQKRLPPASAHREDFAVRNGDAGITATETFDPPEQRRSVVRPFAQQPRFEGDAVPVRPPPRRPALCRFRRREG